MTDFYTDLGLKLDQTQRQIYINSPRNFLIEQSVQKKQGSLTEDGSLVVETGKHTGRSAGDKYVVKSPLTEKSVWWENSINEMTYDNFQKLKTAVLNYLNDGRDLFITERSVGAVEEHNIGVRTITDHPSHALFSKHLFRPKMRDFKNSDFTILHAPEMEVNPADYGAKTGTIITTCFDTNTTIIIGSLYAGEIKKSMFCIMNYVLPDKNVLPMHAGACRMENEDVSIFFGLSGTGKTTLSTDEGTFLIGDDEHGLSDEGVFNFEGGCYAKTYKLSKETEPGIFDASNRFGALLENVVLDKASGKVDYFDKSLSENGRSSYPLRFIDGLEPSSKGKVPNNIFFLTADAFGVLPPVSKLSKEQAMFYFVLGYTSKLAGTEIGVKEPQATFSPCFGAPFMLRHPSEYAKLLGQYLDRYEIDVWLVNTGWTGGPYGVGQRFPLHVTREIIRTIQAGKLNKDLVETDPLFGLQIPQEIGTVSQTLLNPQRNWDKEADYIAKAEDLAKSFHTQMKNFGEFYNENLGGAPTFGA
ncbi:MAG: phosphoenolpyruvate carboxykinase (ATP) [Bacteriovoracaceae bacterium]|nr:phosphoenolpyruvate carboxykinase (ATP) [Bacteriovoracaceae bacterium]